VIGRLRFRLSKHFGAKNVLDDFALEVRGGELVTVLGPSGCAKSTALNLLAGLLAPSAGEIRLDDQPGPHAAAGDLRAAPLHRADQREPRVGRAGARRRALASPTGT
jgi:ABC-type sulfate/molybdate transport systems ATPase subunit